MPGFIKIILITFLVIIALVVYYVINSIVTNIIVFKINLCREKKGKKRKERGAWLEYKDQMEKGRKWFYDQKPEDVWIESFDGLKLHAYYLPSPQGEKKSRGFTILMHGFHGEGANDFAGITEFLYRNNYSILIPDQRAHGLSEGEVISFGIKERKDCLGWINFLRNKFSENKIKKMPVFLMGISMGASTVLMTGGDNSIDDFVNGIVADCGFTVPYDITKERIIFLGNFFATVAMFFTAITVRIMGKYDLKDYSTFESLKTNTRPVLFIHGKNDQYVPMRMTMENYEACRSEKELYLSEGGHGLSFMSDPEKYEKCVIDFFDAHRK